MGKKEVNFRHKHTERLEKQHFFERVSTPTLYFFLNQLFESNMQTIRKQLSVLFLLPILIFSCGKKEIPRAKEIPEAVKSYVYAYTSGVISKSESVRIRFSGSAVSEDLIGKEADSDILEFSPSMGGELVWEDDHTIVFSPKNNWESGQSYIGKVDLSEVFENLPEAAQNFEFDFLIKEQGLSVEILGIESISPDDLSKQRLVGIVHTNDAVDNDDLEDILTVKQGKRELEIVWQHDGGDTRHTFTADGIERGNEPSEVTVAWDGDDIDVDVEDGMAVTIPALGDFTVLSARVINGESQYISIQFSDPLLVSQNLNGLIALRNSGMNNNTNFNFSIDGNKVLAYPNRQLNGEQTLEVRPGIKNSESAGMTKPTVWQLNFEQQKPKVRLVGRGVILPESDEGLILPFEAISLQAVEVEIFKIFDNNIMQFLQTSELDGQNTYELRRVGKVIRRSMVPLRGLNTGANFSTWTRYALDLGTLFEADPNAIYQVRIGFRPEYSTYACGGQKAEAQLTAVNQSSNLDEDGNIRSFWGDYYGINGYYEGFTWRHRENPCFPAYFNYENFTSTNVLASNLGITAKGGEGGKLLVAVSDLRDTEPVDEATLEFYDYQQQLITSTKTDGDGMAELNLDRKPFLIIAKTEEERGYLKTADANSLSLSRFDVAGTVTQEGLKGFLYGDRGVWRPGDSLFLNFILEDRDATLPDNYPIAFELVDSRGQVQYTTVTTENIDNLYHLPVSTNADDPTGNWLATVKAGGASFSKTIKIETVKPNRLKIDLDFPGDEILSSKDDPMNVDVQVNWLHGAAGKDLKVLVESELSAKNTSFEGFRDFEFDDPARFIYPEPKVIFDGKTDESGAANFTTTLYNKNTPAPGMLRANFRARAFEKGGDASIWNTTKDYSPYSTYTGVLIPQNKYGEKRVDIGSADGTTLKFIAVDEKGNAMSNRNLSIGLYRVEWRWWWDSDNSGVSQFNSGNHFNAMEKDVLKTGSDGQVEWDVNVDSWGRYLVRVCDPESGHCSGDYFYAGYPWYGDDGQSLAQRQEAAMMTFAASKEKYEVGDDIEITVPAGESGRVLITLESGGQVLESFWRKAKKGENKFEFEATEGMSPTVYAHVSLMQPHNKTDNDLPIRMYGVLPIDVENPETNLKPQIKMAEELKPEQEFTVEVSEENGERMAYTIAVVDEGLLGLTNHKTPDPHVSLYAREALGVKTWDLYDYVLGAYGGELNRVLSMGGDGSASAAADRKNANRFKPVVMHAGPFLLKRGKAKHTFKMPNYVGSVRVMLVAANEDAAYGNAEKVVPVKKPLMALATLPRVLGPGENLRLPVSIFAMDKKVKNVDVLLNETTGLVDIYGGKTKALRFPQPDEKMAYFDLRVGDQTGVAKFKITATGGGERAAQEIEIDVRNPNPYVTNVYPGLIAKGETWSQEVIPIGTPGTNDAVLEVSNIPPLKLGERLQYLLRYPHGCIEQTTSASFPQLYVGKLMEMTEEQKQSASNNVKAAIDKLKNFQVASGGFAYWPGGDVNEWGSTYAAHFLLEAKNAGYAVPQTMIDRMVAYQKRVAKQWSPSDRGRRYSYTELQQAYRLYTLALAEQPEKGAMNRLRELPNLSTEARWRLAAAYALDGNKEVGTDLVDGQSTEVTPYGDGWGYTYGSALRDEAMILETLTLLDQKEKAADQVQYIARKLSEDYWYSTQTTSFALLAIGKFVGENSVNDEFKFSYQMPNGQVVNAGSTTPVMQIEVPAEQSGRSISVTNNGSGPLFARLIISGQPKTGAEEDASNNLEIKVAYKSAVNGQAIDPQNIPQGTDFIAEVVVRHPNTRAINYDEMALTQIFPSGWEILNARLHNFDEFSNTNVPEYQDIRDDRVQTYFDLRRNQTHIYRVRLNAAYPGKYYLPAVSCEAMYDANINARVKGMWVNVVSENEI